MKTKFGAIVKLDWAYATTQGKPSLVVVDFVLLQIWIFSDFLIKVISRLLVYFLILELFFKARVGYVIFFLEIGIY